MEGIGHRDAGTILRRPGPLFVLCAAALYVVVYLVTGGLRFPPVRDEPHFWLASLHFAERGWPGLSDLRDYGALNTPLPFLLFGWLEAAGGGIRAGRLLNLCLSFVILGAVALPGAAKSWRAPLAAAGLLLFPYYLGASVMLYTDIVAAFFVLAGVIAYRAERHVLAAGAFVLAIASRQYMVAFPLALVLFDAARGVRRWEALVPQLLACASLLIWIIIFGGFAPDRAMQRWTPATADLWHVRPQHALYFLACVGLYYVVPETVFSRRWPARPGRRRGWIVAGLAGMFLLFPPLANVQGLPTMGYLDRAAHALLPDALRMLLFFGLALLACLRFAERTLPATLVIANAGVMFKAHIAWDKYALPLLVVLWYLYARDT